MRPPLRLRLHRGTTAHVASIYPFSVQGSFGYRGPYIGVDLLAGGAEFCWDPFEAYAAGAITNPNCWILGEPGNGKSALVKSLLWRMVALYGSGPTGRWIAIADPKGEYRALAEWLGLHVVHLSPGGTTRINPLAEGPAADNEPEERRTLRRAEMVTALAATVLDRPSTSSRTPPCSPPSSTSAATVPHPPCGTSPPCSPTRPPNSQNGCADPPLSSPRT